jgi:putative endonuclease
MSFWAYLLHCNAGRLYVGHTDDLERRIAQHETGALPGFTRDYLPVKLVWSEEFPSRYEAQCAEKQLKGGSRAKKLALIRGDWNEIGRLAQGKERQAFDKLRPGGIGNV